MALDVQAQIAALLADVDEEERDAFVAQLHVTAKRLARVLPQPIEQTVTAPKLVRRSDFPVVVSNSPGKTDTAEVTIDGEGNLTFWVAPPGGGGGLSDGDYGDVTVSGSGATITIDNGAVSLAKMASLSGPRIIGRAVTGSGAPSGLRATDPAHGTPDSDSVFWYFDTNDSNQLKYVLLSEFVTPTSGASHFSEVISFDAGECVTRVTIANDGVDGSSSIVGTIHKAGAAEADDQGLLYFANVASKDSGSFELVVVRCDYGMMNASEWAPSESVEFTYTIGTP